MKTLAIVILTKNEEENVAEVVKNAQQRTSEVLIIDSGSTDKTVQLAKENGAKVFYRAWDGDFSAQRNFALDKTMADIVLYLDADERIMPETAEHIKKILAQDKNDLQYQVKRKATAFGETFNHGVLYPDYVLRMFPRDKVRWIGKVHENPECSCKVEKLKGYLEHHTYKNWAAWEKKFQLYTTIWAEDAYQSGKRTSKLAILLHASAGFFKMFVVKAGFLDGWLGLYTCVNHFFYTMIKYLKLLELQNAHKKNER